MFYFGFSLSCDQVYAIIHVTKKGFYGVGGGGFNNSDVGSGIYGI